MTNNLIIAVIIALLAVMAIFAISFSGGGNTTGAVSAGNSSGELFFASGDIIEGKITNVSVNPGKFNGTGVYDRNCVDIGNGLTDCHAGISTSEYGVLNFNYRHNMSMVQCIQPGERVVVEILSSDGKARVQRMW